MIKTNMTFTDRLIVALAGFIAVSVLMLSVHAKDLAHYHDLEIASKIGYRDISDKAVQEMHDHVDKQVLKSFAKTFGDSVTFSRGRDDSEAYVDEDPGLWGRFHERFLLWRIYASLPFAVS